MPVRNLPVLPLALLLSATAGASAHESSSYVQKLQDSLVSHAASDFAASDSNPTGFRKVDMRYRENEHGARTYMLCGQVRTGVGAGASWVDFATVKTKPFEQWLGSAAIETCALATPVSSHDNDLSDLLEAKRECGQSEGKP